MGFNQNDFENGVEAIKKYIAFCWANYTYEEYNSFLAGSEFVRDIIDFVQCKKPYIPNRYGKTFEQFCEEMKNSG